MTAMPTDARLRVDELLAQAAGARASDIHLEPLEQGYEVRLRVDGMLAPIQALDEATGRAMVSRLMVMAQLLTYRLDVPQEGRIPASVGGADLRVAVIPTANGLRAAVRLPVQSGSPQDLESLGLPPGALAGLLRFAAQDTGMLIVTGPAGSGKTTTIYALLRHMAARFPGQSIITLEDPVERKLAGVTQIEVRPHGELTYERALRSILRQDPQVLMLGEIRDAAVAGLALQAAMTGHRLICTLHAGSIASALGRLLDMGLEPHRMTSAVHGVLSQRLLRKAASGAYQGRFPIGEYAPLSPALRQAILDRRDVQDLQETLQSQPGHVTLRRCARDGVDQGLTDEAEVLRVLGEEG